MSVAFNCLRVKKHTASCLVRSQHPDLVRWAPFIAFFMLHIEVKLVKQDLGEASLHLELVGRIVLEESRRGVGKKFSDMTRMHIVFIAEMSAAYGSRCRFFVDDNVVSCNINFRFSAHLSIALKLLKRNTGCFLQTGLALRNTPIQHRTANIHACPYCAYLRLYDCLLQSRDCCIHL